MIENRNFININTPSPRETVNPLSENLLRIMFKYCSYKDLLRLSEVSRQFNRLAKENDVIYRDVCDKIYCSQYMNYRYVYIM